jgi:hypothetical protein
MVTIVDNIALDDSATGTQTGTVGEPSVAMAGQRIFVTGNWFASRSTDRGTSWTPLDPFTEFPASTGEFCCDQLAVYVKPSRLWVWFLQYSVSAGTNIVRIAVSKTAQSGSWHWWDLRPRDVNPAWGTFNFDYPDLAVSNGNLWISTNVYDSADQWKAAAVIRYPLTQLGAQGALSRRTWTTTDVGSLRFVQGAGDTMWFGATTAAGQPFALFAWKDADSQVQKWHVPTGDWRDDKYSSKGPGGAEWLSRLDSRVTGAWQTNGVLGFAWCASPRPGRPNPYIKVIRIDERSLTVKDEPDLWSATGAWAYPACAPNARGQIGMTAFFGGPTHPAHAVGCLDEVAGTWDMAITATSTNGPGAGKWGDYLVCRAHPSRVSGWIASGYTLDGGTDRRNIEPRVVAFRR